MSDITRRTAAKTEAVAGRPTKPTEYYPGRGSNPPQKAKSQPTPFGLAAPRCPDFHETIRRYR